MNLSKKPLAYIPPGAEINLENIPAEPPKTQYEERKFIFDKEAVKKIVKGDYGKED